MPVLSPYSVRLGSGLPGPVSFGLNAGSGFTEPVFAYTIAATDGVAQDLVVAFTESGSATLRWYIERASPTPVQVRGVAGSGIARVGEVLTVTPGVYNGVETIVLTYQWYADDVAINAATGTSYTPVVGDIDAYIHVVETATNTNGTATSQSADIGPITAATDPGGALLGAFDVWLNGATDLVAGATDTITPTNGSTITIGANTSATSTDPTITSTSITGDGVDDYLIFGDIPSVDVDDSFTVVLALKAPTKAESTYRTFFSTNNTTATTFGVHIYNETGATERVMLRVRGVSASQVIFGNLLPSIYDGELWVVVAQVTPSTIKLQTYDGSTLSTQSSSRTGGDATQVAAPRLFGVSTSAAAEVFAVAYTQDSFTDGEVTDIGDYLLTLHGGA